MKQSLIALFLLLAIGACKPQDTPTSMADIQQMIDSGELKGTWKFSKMVASWGNQETPAADFDYQEFYEFSADGTFRKYRSSGESDSGTYEVKDLSDGKYIITTYTEGATLPVSCTPGQEALKIEENGVLYGGALPCDGPALYYEPFGENAQ